MLFLLPGLKVCLVLLGLAALFSLLTLILGADVRLVNERLIFIVDPRRALAFLIANIDPTFLGCVHTPGDDTIRPFLGPDVHLYFRTILPPVRLQICTTPSDMISLICIPVFSDYVRVVYYPGNLRSSTTMVLKSPATIVPVAPMITFTMLLLPDCMSSWIFSTFSSIFSKRVSRFLYLCSHKSTCASKFSFSNLVAILLLASNVNIALWKRPSVLPIFN